jgi:hypothetical protein
MGHTEGSGYTGEGEICTEQDCWSQGDESSHAEEAIGDDEGTLGDQEEGRIGEPDGRGFWVI